ncbi:MAG TPA: hypothetical protein VGX28_04935 [Frankiaceae bacterium]|nr:hypothetical protein [Frankiaceae bacterium]
MTCSSRRRAVVAALAVATVLGSGAAGAAPSSTAVPARDGVLSTGTTLAWTGAKGLRLRVPARATLPEYGARLFVTRGTYAHVRVVRVDSRCAHARCGALVRLDYLRATADEWATTAGPGTQHWANIGNGNVVEAGLYEVYLMTDGEARLTFDATGLPRALRTYRATGRISGGAVTLPIACPTVGCDAKAGYAGRARVGGQQVDVGRLGYVDVAVGSFDRKRPPLWQYPQSRYGRGCVYPHNETDPSSPEPADHPWGCEVVGRDADATAAYGAHAANGGLGMVPVYTGYYTGDGNVYASGKTYLGHQVVTSHDVADTQVVAFGVWFSYGVG